MTPGAGRSYAHAHWYFLAAFAAIIAGFWPSFFQPLSGGSPAHTVHGVSATLWVLVLITQSWLMSRGMVWWHRRVAFFGLALLPVLVFSALLMVKAMLVNPQMPPFLPPLLSFIDLPSLVFLLVLVGMGLRNIRTPAAHKRFMAATILLSFPPALTRLYARVFAPHVDFMMALHGSFVTVEVILVALIASDWRAGERRAAYPLSLLFFSAVHLLMTPVAASDWWQAFLSWYGSIL